MMVFLCTPDSEIIVVIDRLFRGSRDSIVVLCYAQGHLQRSQVTCAIVVRTQHRIHLPGTLQEAAGQPLVQLEGRPRRVVA